MKSETGQPAQPRAASIPAEGGESSNILPISLRHVRRRWYVLPADLRDLGLGLCPALHRCDAAAARALQLDISLPYRIAWLVHGPHPRGAATSSSSRSTVRRRRVTGAARGQPFFKIIAGACRAMP